MTCVQTCAKQLIMWRVVCVNSHLISCKWQAGLMMGGDGLENSHSIISDNCQLVGGNHTSAHRGSFHDNCSRLGGSEIWIYWMFFLHLVLHCVPWLDGLLVTGDLVKVRVGLGENECNTTSPTSMREKPQTRPISEKSCCQWCARLPTICARAWWGRRRGWSLYLH